MREHAFDACTVLAWCCLGAPVVALAAPWLGAFGMALASCVALAPLFRMFALRWLGEVPEPVIGSARRELSRMRIANWAELALGGSTALFTVLGSAGLVPSGTRWIYLTLVSSWFVAIVATMWLQSQLADRLAPRLVEPGEIPTGSTARTRAALLAATALLAAATAFAVASAAANAPAWIGNIAALLFVLGGLATIAACLVVAAQALLLGQCVLACRELLPSRRSVAFAFISRTDATPLLPPSAVPPEHRHAANARSDDDDKPIPLS